MADARKEEPLGLVAVPAAERTRLEQLYRYLLRPAVAQDRLRLLADGRVVLTLKTAWADGRIVVNSFRRQSV